MPRPAPSSPGCTTPTSSAPAGSNHPTRRSTACTRTWCGACAATSSTSPPTARSETSGSAGPATSRCSARPPRRCFDVSGMLSGWLRDLAIEQLPDGTVPWYVPVIPAVDKWTPIRPGAAWGDVATLLPWTLYERFGDVGVLEAQFDSARRVGRPARAPVGPVAAVGHGLPAGRLARPGSPAGRPRRRPHRPSPRGHGVLREVRAHGGAHGRGARTRRRARALRRARRRGRCRHSPPPT